MDLDSRKDPTGLSDTMMPWIAKTMKLMEAFLQLRLKDAGIELSRKQVIVLKILRIHGPLPQNDLAFITERDKASLARFINTLEKKNLVARIPSQEDKRINLVHLTKQGEKAFEETLPHLRAAVDQFQKNISEKDKKTVIEVMKKIQQNISLDEK